MAATIKLKRGTSQPSTSDIANGEVAIATDAVIDGGSFQYYNDRQVYT